MQSSDIRSSFIDFFRERGHRHLASSSLVPAGDPTLLFTNAGMVQFKRVFQGLEKRDYSRAVTSQKCVRAGGKHNDLEQVGLTARHHTFFEMLGNFSFGDYFKKEAIEYAWEWVTSEEYLGIHPDRIFISVHHTDQEARRLWREVAGLSDDRIYGMGDKDNFWQMGDTGPCGPCSEVYVDLRHEARRPPTPGASPPPTPPLTPGASPGPASLGPPSPGPTPSLSEFIELGEKGLLFEIWNLVFMQFDQQPDGSRPPLPAPSVDTGAGLERIAAVMQDVESNYDTDLFMPIIDRAEELIEKPYHEGPEGVGFRVLADHARAVAFLLADGVYPSNYGRGYVLRRILRRAVRHAYLLGREEPTLAPLAQVVVDNLGDVYPELREKASHIESVTRAEEERFLETIEGGLRRLEELTRGPAGTVSGEDAFKLYDTYGFPLDLTQVAAAERGWRVDEVGFERALSRQQLRSRAAGKRAAGGEIRNRETGQRAGRPATGGEAGKRGAGSVRSRGGKWVRVIPRKRQRWIGYETTRAETDILAFRKSSDRLELVLHENPFYAESGGQVSDTGVVKGEGWELPVEDVYVVDARKVVAGAFEGDFEPTPVEAAVAEARRRNIERNHTATHLVHAALRAVLGDHVRQAGSVVAPERLRFDFSHHAPMTEDELRSVEERVNEAIWLNPEVLHYQLPYGDAIARGAMALFGEKYGDRVRVVDVPGISLELCGGTHVRTTGQIGLFRFTGETGVAAGVRRIEAVTGPGAYEVVRWLDEHMSDAAGRLHTNPEFVARKIEGLIDEKRRLEKQVEELLRETGSVQREAFDEFRFGESTVLVGESPVTDRNQVGLLMDAFRARNRNAVQVLFVSRERPGIHVAVTDDLVRRGVEAGDLVNRIAAVSGGRGGGRPHFASAGAGDPAKLPEARRKTPDIVRDILGAGAN